MMIAAVMEVPGLAMRITKSAATGPRIGQCSQGGSGRTHFTLQLAQQIGIIRIGANYKGEKIRTEFGRNRPSMVCHSCGRKEIS